MCLHIHPEEAVWLSRSCLLYTSRGDLRIPIIEYERLKEISFGPYEGLCCGKEGYSIPDPEFVNLFQNPAHYNPPEGGESIAQLCVRTTDFLTELIENPDNREKTILLSGHGACVKGLLSSLLKMCIRDRSGAGKA